MSVNIVLVVVGIALFLLGLLVGGSRSGGFILKNIGINIGSTNTQTITVGDGGSPSFKPAKQDWVGLAISIIGLVTTVVGLFKD
jgi:hypothetical protein